MFPKIKSSRSLSQQAYEAIKKAIMTNQLKPREFLREEALADSMGISRTPVKAALKRLQFEKLVTVTATKQVFVSEVRPGDMLNMLAFRLAVEPAVAKMACAVISKKMLTGICECLKNHEVLLREGNTEKVIDSELRFGALIAQGTENEFFIDSMTMINTYMQRFLAMSGTTPDDVTHSIKEHKAIYETLLARDAAGAEEQTRLHLTNVIARFGFELPF